jgi:hypothetical protein
MTSGPSTGEAVPADVRRAWEARADAAARYAGRLGEHDREAADVIESLLHLHHNRVHGPGPASEAATYRLARAAALGHTARPPAPAAPP